MLADRGGVWLVQHEAARRVAETMFVRSGVWLKWCLANDEDDDDDDDDDVDDEWSW